MVLSDPAREIRSLEQRLSRPESFQRREAIPIARRRDDPGVRLRRDVQGRLPECRRCPADEQRLTRLELQVPKETGPGRRVRFGNGGELLPGQARLDRYD